MLIDEELQEEKPLEWLLAPGEPGLPLDDPALPTSITVDEVRQEPERLMHFLQCRGQVDAADVAVDFAVHRLRTIKPSLTTLGQQYAELMARIQQVQRDYPSMTVADALLLIGRSVSRGVDFDSVASSFTQWRTPQRSRGTVGRCLCGE